MSNRMWGGRFSSGPDAIMEEINASIDPKSSCSGDSGRRIDTANVLSGTVLTPLGRRLER